MYDEHFGLSKNSLLTSCIGKVVAICNRSRWDSCPLRALLCFVPTTFAQMAKQSFEMTSVSRKITRVMITIKRDTQIGVSVLDRVVIEFTLICWVKETLFWIKKVIFFFHINTARLKIVCM